MNAVSLAIGVILPGVAVGSLFRLKEFPLALAVGAARIVDPPADFPVMHRLADFHSVPFGALKSNRRGPKGAEVSPSFANGVKKLQFFPHLTYEALDFIEAVFKKEAL
jgi:hypothetical protein